MLYFYRCKIKRVIDGDTIVVDIDLGFDTWIRNEHVRLSKVDTPEIRTSDPVEKQMGYLAKERVEELFPVDTICYLESTEYRSSKYGRCLGDLYLTVDATSSLCDILLEERLAVPWVDDKAERNRLELDNRQWLLENNKITA